MSNLLRYLFLGILILELTACMPSKPYEIKSPCVTGENESNVIIPCIRRPVNIDIA